jgi:glucosylceramidase
MVNGIPRRPSLPRSGGAALLITALALLQFSCASKSAVGARFYESDGKSDFAARNVKELPSGLADVKVSDKPAGAPLEGFGGAFNEKGWVALQALPAKELELAMDRIFKPGLGLSLNFCRIPIGSSDYALSRYSLDDKENDYSLSAFSIDRDKQALIPFVKAAQSISPGLRFWASAWSPPPWMKDSRSYDYGFMRDDARVYSAYALYLKKFAQAYGAEGIPIEAIAVQNEPGILRAYPTCGWASNQYLSFVRDYLGPALEGSGTGVMLGTFNSPEDVFHAQAVLSDPKAKAYVKCLGLQWDGIPIIISARSLMPDLPVWHTETDCGNHHWEPGFDPDKPQNDFAYAAYTWGKMRDYLKAGASLYSLWNIVLDPEGKSIDAGLPWPQNSAIVADPSSGKAVYTPMFYAFSSFSRFLPPGSRLLRTSGLGDALAFALPDGGKAVVLMNNAALPHTFNILVDGKMIKARLKAKSFGTLVMEKKK